MYTLVVATGGFDDYREEVIVASMDQQKLDSLRHQFRSFLDLLSKAHSAYERSKSNSDEGFLSFLSVYLDKHKSSTGIDFKDVLGHQSIFDKAVAIVEQEETFPLVNVSVEGPILVI